MTTPDDGISNEWSLDVARVAQEMAGRLRTLGVAVYDSDSPDEVMRLVEGVEEFEEAVESRGGDLMMDEPPASGTPQPDDPHFLLPTRAADESVAQYLTRLSAATAAVREHPLAS
jgi:hypothetical protein